MHHPVRRRKRRSHGVSSSASFSAIGVRSVDVLRGSNGFGFTISGQQPCLLSCIVAGSPAEVAGLRPGHALVAVNGRSVARLPHDTVVRLIGSCAGTLRLHVSENYYPESSDSDIEDVDSYLPRRPAQGRAARVVRDLQSGAMFVEKTPPRPVISPPLQLPPRGVQNPPPPPPPSRTSPTDFRAVVGYLGTIELPKELRPGSRLAVIRSCVRRMRAEKRIHTIVTLTVRREQSVLLSDALGTILAEFPAERVAFCGACADDKRFFGLVTSVSNIEDDDVATACGGSSCHVFMIDPSLHPHHAHINRAAAFRIQCTTSGDGCAEFPALADPILRAVAALYNPNPSPPPPPPRSNTSSCPSSNSDSGIGFRDEILNSEDLSSNHHSINISQQRLTVRAMPDPPNVIQQQMKLSPKVYGMPMLMAQSLEDIPSTPAMPSGDESMTSLEHQQWGSLQDLRKLESSPVRHRRRRKHPTHHQHPSEVMPPPPLAMSTGNASLPSTTPQGSDEETDFELPFKKWCSGSYFGKQHPAVMMLPPLSPLPSRINFSTISQTSTIPTPSIMETHFPVHFPTKGEQYIDKLTLSTVLSPNDSVLFSRFIEHSPDVEIRNALVSTENSWLETPKSQMEYKGILNDNDLTPKAYESKEIRREFTYTSNSCIDSPSGYESLMEFKGIRSVNSCMDTPKAYESEMEIKEIRRVFASPENFDVDTPKVSNYEIESKENRYEYVRKEHSYTEIDDLKVSDTSMMPLNEIRKTLTFNENSWLYNAETPLQELQIQTTSTCIKKTIHETPKSVYEPETPLKALHSRYCSENSLFSIGSTISSNFSSQNSLYSANSLSPLKYSSQNSINSNNEEYKFFTPITTVKISQARCKSLTTLKSKENKPILSPIKSESCLTPKSEKPVSVFTPLAAKTSQLSLDSDSEATPAKRKRKSLLFSSEKRGKTPKKTDENRIRKTPKSRLFSPKPKPTRGDKFLKPLTPRKRLIGTAFKENKTHHKDGDCSRDMSARSHSEGGGSEADHARGGPASCFDSFEKLLDDPNGMHAFAEFLKKEFSHENIYFWVACEKYRRLKEVAARKAHAKCIYQRHLAMGAPEPVNVDSQARQSAKDGLEEARPDLFLSSQKQIFNLMKFDSYPRFLKCDSYKDSLDAPLVELDPDLLLHARDEPNPGKLKKSRSDAEDRRRKSLLPWHRKNAPSRSKSRDRNASGSATGDVEEPLRLDDSSSVRSCSELTGSRSSLASSDLALIQRGSNSRQSLSSGDTAELCRVILPDGATTVVPTVRGESAKQLIVRLLEKRGLHFSSFELFTATSSKPLVLSEDSSILSGKEIRVEQRVVFRLDLPSRKTVGVKAKAGRSLAEVLKPILHKYGYRLENTTVTLICDTEPLDPTLLITAVENQRLQINVSGSEAYKEKCKSVPGVTLDEITNRVFEELLQGKTADSLDTGKLSARQGAHSDQGSVRSEDWSSEHSSGIFGRFLRRDSAFMDKTRESRSKGKKCPSTQASKHASLELDPSMVPMVSSIGTKVNNKQPAGPINKWKNNLKAHGRSESDELYEGLKRAQRSRLEDQRGTEINFELPDFLKVRKFIVEETPQSRRMKKGRLTEEDCVPLMNMEGVDLSSPDGIIPTNAQAEAYFASRLTPLRCSLTEHDSPTTLDRTIIDLDTTIMAPQPPLRHNSDPPPLPPKPKTFPAHRSKWNNNPTFCQSSASEDEGKGTTSFV